MSELDPARWREIQTSFNELVDLGEAAQRERLALISQSDPDLGRAVERLLRADAHASDRLERIDSVLRPRSTELETQSHSEIDLLGLTGRTLAHFRVLEPIAVGGMGVVYRAEDIQLGRAVALKLPLPGRWFARDARDRFLREGRAAGALDHANVCAIYEVGEADGHLYIAMPLYPGETLAARIARVRTLPISDALSIAQSIARGLAAAHAAGLIHRDVKPGNVMLLPDGGVKVLDFGLAKPDEVSLSTGGTMVGTVAYMAPEQIRGASLDARVDLWGLGVVLYEMLTGRRPFSGERDIAVAHAILHDDPPSVRDVRPEIPTAVLAVVQRLLAKDRDHRPPSADVAEADLRAAASGRTIRRRRLTRHTGSTAAAALLLVGGAVVGTAIWRRPTSPETKHQASPPPSASTDIDASAIVAGKRDSAQTNDSLRALRPLPDSAKESVIVADLETAPGDSLIAETLTDIIRRGLSNSPSLRAMSEQRVNLERQRLHLSATAPLTSQVAKQIALREGVRDVVDGSLRSFGGQYALSLRLLSAFSGEKIAGGAKTGIALGHLPQALDTLARELSEQARAELPMLRSQPSIIAMTSTSLQAMIDYTTALRLPKDSAARAVELLSHAIALDSSFASAYWHLAIASTYTRRVPPDSVRQGWLAKAWAHREGLTDYEQRRVDIAYHDSPNGIAPNFDLHKEHLVGVVERYPNADDALLLGDMYFDELDLPAAERTYRLVLSLDSSRYDGYRGLVNTYLLEKNYREARNAAEIALRRFPAEFNPQGLKAVVWYAQGRPDSARAIMRRLTAFPGQIRALAYSDVATLELLEGRLGAWAETLRARDSIAGSMAPAFGARRPRLLAAYWVMQRPELAVPTLDSIVAADPSMRRSPGAHAAAEFYALLGRPDSARAILTALGAPTRRTNYWKGTDTIAAYAAIDLTEARPRDAADEFREALRFTGGDAPWQISRDAEIGLALEKAGSTDSAIARYEHFLNGTPMWNQQAYKLVWVLEHVAKLYERKGDTKKARAAYARIVQLWKNADPELQPRVDSARAKAAALR